MLAREELELSYLNHVKMAHDHLDAARTARSSVTKGMHIAQALAASQLATAAATALANNVAPWPATAVNYPVRVER